MSGCLKVQKKTENSALLSYVCPTRILAGMLSRTPSRPPAGFIAQEDATESRGQVIADLAKGEPASRTCGGFDEELVAVEVVELLEGLDQ